MSSGFVDKFDFVKRSRPSKGCTETARIRVTPCGPKGEDYVKIHLSSNLMQDLKWKLGDTVDVGFCHETGRAQLVRTTKGNGWKIVGAEAGTIAAGLIKFKLRERFRTVIGYLSREENLKCSITPDNSLVLSRNSGGQL